MTATAPAAPVLDHFALLRDYRDALIAAGHANGGLDPFGADARAVNDINGYLYDAGALYCDAPVRSMALPARDRDANIARISNRTAHNALTDATVTNRYGLTPAEFDDMQSGLSAVIAQYLYTVDQRVAVAVLERAGA